MIRLKLSAVLLVFGDCYLGILAARRSSDSSSDSSSSSKSDEDLHLNSSRLTTLKTQISTYGPNYIPLFRSLSETIALLESGEFKDKPEVMELLHTYEEKCVPDIPKGRHSKKRRPFVAIESQFPSIRKTAGTHIADILYGIYIKIPPTCLVPLRNSFENNKILRRAYYSLCYFAAAHVARQAYYNKPVFVGGYWHDHAAFALSRKYELDKLPKKGSPEYKWPKGLLMPDVVFHINPLDVVIPEATPTESPNTFKKRIVEIYRRITRPLVIEINNTFLYKNVVTIMQAHMLDLFTGRKRINKDVIHE